MKMYMLIVTVMLCTVLQAQDIPSSQVPPAVLSAFKAKFHDVSRVEWEKKGTLYEAAFDINRVDYKAVLNQTGKLEKYKHDIRASELPRPVSKTISTQYKDYRIDDVQLLERNGVTFYQVELDGEPHDQKVVFTKDGKVDSNEAYW